MTILSKNIEMNLLKLCKYNGDVFNIILQISGYKLRNGKYIQQIFKNDNRYTLLYSIPKINIHNQYQVRMKISNNVVIISTSIYCGFVHWYMTTDDYSKRDIIHYIYRPNNKENLPSKKIMNLFS
jgi:hypothetical protein